MATSTSIQYLETSGVSVSGAVVQNGANVMNRRTVEVFLTETAITAGQLVSLDIAAAKTTLDSTGGLSSATVITSLFTTLARKAVVGVALESVTGTAASPQPIKVVIRGPVPMNCVAVVALGDTLCADTAAASAGLAMVTTGAILNPPLAYAMVANAVGAGTNLCYFFGLGS